jgi:hypothetical protein
MIIPYQYVTFARVVAFCGLRDLEVGDLLHEICLIWHLSSHAEGCHELGWD